MKRSLLDPAYGQRKVQASGAPQRVGLPGIPSAGAQHTSHVSRGRGTNACPDVGLVARVFQEHYRSPGAVGEQSPQVYARSFRDRDHAGPGCLRSQLRERVRRNDSQPGSEAAAKIRGQERCETIEFVRVGTDHRRQCGSEPQSVLYGVNAFEHCELRVPPGGSELFRDPRKLGHNSQVCTKRWVERRIGQPRSARLRPLSGSPGR